MSDFFFENSPTCLTPALDWGVSSAGLPGEYVLWEEEGIIQGLGEPYFDNVWE